MRRRLGSCSAEDLREDLRRCAGLLVVAWAALGFFASGARADGEASGVQSTRTAKERLGGRRATNSGSTIARCPSISAVRSRARTTAATAQPQRQSTDSPRSVPRSFGCDLNASNPPAVAFLNRSESSQKL